MKEQGGRFTTFTTPIHQRNRFCECDMSCVEQFANLLWEFLSQILLRPYRGLTETSFKELPGTTRRATITREFLVLPRQYYLTASLCVSCTHWWYDIGMVELWWMHGISGILITVLLLELLPELSTGTLVSKWMVIVSEWLWCRCICRGGGDRRTVAGGGHIYAFLVLHDVS